MTVLRSRPAAGRGAGRDPESTRSRPIRLLAANWQPLAFFVALTLAAYHKVVFSHLVLVGYDTLSYFFPYRAYAAWALGQGGFPEWDPYLFGGAPFLANAQTAIFYPLNLLFLLLPAAAAYVYSVLLHVLLAGLFTYLYLRLSLGVSPAAAATGGAVFMLSGFLGSQVGHINQVNVAVWMPLLFLCFDLARRRSRAVFLAALVVALQFLAGHTQESYVMLAGLTLYAGFGLAGLWATARGSERWRLALALARAYLGSLALGALVSAVQLLPTAELAGQSIRAGGMTFREVSSFSLPASLALVDLLPRYWDVKLGGNLNLSTEYIQYVGVLGLLLAGVGALLGRPRGAALALATLGLLGFALALGSQAPYFHWLYDHGPGFKLFRVPARWLYLNAFASAALAGLGVEALARRQRPDWWRLPPLLAALVGLALLLPRQLRLPRDVVEAWLSVAGLGVALGAALLLRPRSPLARLAVPACVAAELLLAARQLPYNLVGPAALYTEVRPTVAHLLALGTPDRNVSLVADPFDPGDLGILRALYLRDLGGRQFDNFIYSLKFQELLTPNTALAYRLASVDGYDGGVLPLARYVRYKGLLVDPAVNVPDQIFRNQLGFVPDLRLFSPWNVRYVVADKLRDVVADGVYYDLSAGATLDANRRQIELTEGAGFLATSVRIVSHLEGLPQARDGERMAEVVVRDGDGQEHTLPLRAGQETAEGLPGPTPPAHGHPPEIKPSYGDLNGTYYAGALPLGVSAYPAAIRIRLLAPTGRLAVRAVTLVNDDTRAWRTVTVSANDDLRLAFSGDLKVYENRAAAGPVYLRARGIPAQDDAQALATLASPDFDPRQAVTLQAGDPPWWLRMFPGRFRARWAPPTPPPFDTAAGEALGTVNVVSYAAGDVVAHVNAPGPRLVVLPESYYPGWRAQVDGQDAPILRANLLYQVIVAPAGEHTVSFHFRSTSYRLGLPISVAAALLCSLPLVGSLARRLRGA